MDYYRNILITGCSSGLGQALFNKVWEDDNLNPFGHYRTEDGDPHALIGDITDPDFCLLYTSPSPRDRQKSRMPSSA